MKYLILSIAVTLGLSMSAQVNSWGISNGIACNYDSDKNCLLGADDLGGPNGVGITVNCAQYVYTSGILVFEIDGVMLAMKGVFTNGSWVTADAVDSDCGKFVRMLKAGRTVRIFKNSRLIYENTLYGFTSNLSKARYQ